jgi:MoaA/NifB/PqqE/SkfB family radical SAM enzyme
MPAVRQSAAAQGARSFEPGELEPRESTWSISFRSSGSPFAAVFLPFEEFARQVDATRDVAALHLEGFGEPMLHPRFFDLVEYATRAGLRVSTYTNGTVLQRVSAERCVTSGLDTLRLAFDAVRAGRPGVRGRLGRESMLRQLDPLVAAREWLGSGHPRLHVVAVLMRRNLDELPLLVERAACHGAESVTVEALGPRAAGSVFPRAYHPTLDCVERESLLRESPERIARVFAAAIQAAARHGIALALPHVPTHRMLAGGRPGAEQTPSV